MVVSEHVGKGDKMFQRYSKMMEQAANLPTVEVTEEEFVQAMIDDGKSEDDARFQATMSKGLGSSVMVGDRKLKIKAGIV